MGKCKGYAIRLSRRCGTASYYPEDSIVRRDIAVMYSNIYRMDCFVRQMIDELKAAGEWDNTILIFYSDNGGPLPRQKREITEVGTHIPLIIRYPDGRLAGSIDDGLRSVIDIPPTILSLAGIKPPAYMDGKAFAGKYASPSRRYVFAARDRMDKCYDQQGACAIAVIVISVIILPISPAISR